MLAARDGQIVSTKAQILKFGHLPCGAVVPYTMRPQCCDAALRLAKRLWAISSAVEHLVDIEGVTSSILVSPTIIS